MRKPSVTLSGGAISGSPSMSVPRIFAVISASLAFILYIVTCSPTINFTDSRELVAVAWAGGIAHPPGYPLYSLISGIFIHLPFGDPAWRMNMLSALFAALGIGIFYGLVTSTLAGMPEFRRIVASRSARARTSNAPQSRSPAMRRRRKKPSLCLIPGEANLCPMALAIALPLAQTI